MRVALALAVLALSSCGELDLQGGTLICATDHSCPTGYHCAADDRCWPDGSDPAPGDMAVVVDGKLPPPDFLGRDTTGIDLASPPDLVSLPDATMSMMDQAMPPPDLAKTVDATSGASDFAMQLPDATSGASDLAMKMPDAVSGATDMKMMVMVPDGGL